MEMYKSGLTNISEFCRIVKSLQMQTEGSMWDFFRDNVGFKHFSPDKQLCKEESLNYLQWFVFLSPVGLYSTDIYKKCLA